MKITKDNLWKSLVQAVGPENMSKKVEKAFDIAWSAHKGQYRSQRGDAQNQRLPYIVHPVGVAINVANFFATSGVSDDFEDVIAAALLHDVVEDTEVGVEDISKEISDRVAEIVLTLTKPDLESGTIGDRNEAFTEQIIQAGKTAVFIKICDYLHNSNPRSLPITPTYIIEKSVKKAEKNYVRFFEGGDFYGEIHDVFLEHIKNSKEVLGSRGEKHAKPLKNIDDVMEYCVFISEEKVLEIHDVLEVLEKVTQAQIIQQGKGMEYLDTLFSDDENYDQKTRSEVHGAAVSGVMDLDTIFKKNSYPYNFVYVLKIKSNILTEDNDTIFIHGMKKDFPDWLQVNSLKVISAFLLERAFQNHKEKTKSLAIQSVRLKLDLRARDLIRLEKMKINLFQFRKFLDYSEYIQKKIVSILEYHLYEKLNKKSNIILETRLKKAGSIIKKMRLRDIADYAQIDDIIGVRIICMNRKEARAIVKNIEEVLEKQLIDKGSSEALFVKEAESSDGYRALHVSFFSGRREKVGCEIQVRTIQQQAWSEISNNVLYKKNTESSKQKRKAMKDIAELRDKADEIIDNI